jgi:dTDP-4-dehydrorhamnose reductase
MAIVGASQLPFTQILARMHRIALLGASGFIGAEVLRQIQLRGHDSVRIDRHSYRSSQVDVLIESLRQAAPDYLINCAGYTGKPNVDACEKHKWECLAGNAVLPGIVAEACGQLNLPWGHLSSGCIYTGCRDDGRGFREQDTPNFTFRQNNCSFYSGTKALGEEVLSDAANCYIWRLRIPFSNRDSARNYLSKLMRYERLLDADNSLSELTECVAACLDCFEKKVPFGIYNLTNPGHIRASEVVKMIQAAGITDKKFEFFRSETEFLEHAAKTPRSNCILDSGKALRAGLQLSEVRVSIQNALKTWTCNPSESASAAHNGSLDSHD